MITDLVIAARSEAAAIVVEPVPTRRWRGLASQALEPKRLAALASLIEGSAADPQALGARAQRFREVLSASEAGPWILQVPEEWTSTVAAIGDADLERLAAAWRATPGLPDPGWSADEALGVLRELRSLAGEALRAGKPLLLCWSLWARSEAGA